MEALIFMKKIKLIIFIIFLVFICQFHTLIAQENNKISKPQAAEDYAIALLWKADPGLIWSTMNYGRIFNGRAETDFYWPTRTHSPEGQHGGTSSIIFAVKDNVIESFSQALSAPQDWLPKDGGLQTGNNVTSGDHTSLYTVHGSVGDFPASAMSDVPEGLQRTWPLRVDPVDGAAKPWWPGNLPEGFTDQDRFNTKAPWALAEREAYMVFNDKYNIAKPSLGIEIEEQVYNYAREYAKDFGFVNLIIHNTSDSTIHNAYFGYRFFLVDAIGGTNNNYLVASNTGWNPDPEKPDFFYVYMPNRGNIPPGHIPALAGVHVLRTPKGDDGKELGVTDFHFFVPPGPLTDEAMWAVINSDPTNSNLPGEKSEYFHNTGADNRIDNTNWIPENKPGGSWWAFFAMSGPFDLDAGEADTASFALIGGYDLPYILNNVETLQEMASNGYRGPSPPPIPKFTSSVSDGESITLTWDAEAETDPNFEGYKLYRREISTITTPPWGKEILDPKGNVVGVLPIAQFDKVDGITGTNSLDPYLFLGTDTGIKHTYVDKDVIPGVLYQYTIIAYSKPLPNLQLPPLANTLGAEIAGGKVVPDPNGTVLGHAPADAIKIAPTDSFWIQVETIIPSQINDYEYEVTFSDRTIIVSDTIYQQGYNLINLSTGDTLLTKEPITDISGDNTSVIDGFRINFHGRPSSTQIERVWNKNSTVQDGSKYPYWDFSFFPAAAGKDFIIKIDVENPSQLNEFGTGNNVYTVPLKIFDATTNTELTQYASVFDFAARNPDNPDYGQPAGAWSLVPGGPNWNPIVEKNNTISLSDFIVVEDSSGNRLFNLLTIQPPDASAPSNGDELFVGAVKPFPRDAVYNFETVSSKVNTAAIDLTKVRAVPNPYYVKARWDTEANIRTIKFINLPEICDIDIFTISGDLVRHIEHRKEFVPPANPDQPGSSFNFTQAGLGFHDWELVSDSGIEVGYGIYVYVVTTPNGGKQVGKLAVIR